MNYKATEFYKLRDTKSARDLTENVRDEIVGTT